MLLSPKSLLMILAAIFLFFAFVFSEKHIARFFDYKSIDLPTRKRLALSWRLTSLGLSFILAGAAAGRGILIAGGIGLMVFARGFGPPRTK